MAELGCDINWLLTGKDLNGNSTQPIGKFTSGNVILVSHVENIVAQYEKLLKQKDEFIEVLNRMLDRYKKEE